MIISNLACKSNKHSKTRQNKRMLRAVPVFCSILVLYHILGDPMTVNRRSATGPEFLSLQDTEQNALLAPPQAVRCLGKYDPRNSKNHWHLVGCTHHMKRSKAIHSTTNNKGSKPTLPMQSKMPSSVILFLAQGQ